MGGIFEKCRDRTIINIVQNKKGLVSSISITVYCCIAANKYTVLIGRERKYAVIITFLTNLSSNYVFKYKKFALRFFLIN